MWWPWSLDRRTTLAQQADKDSGIQVEDFPEHLHPYYSKLVTDLAGMNPEPDVRKVVFMADHNINNSTYLELMFFIYTYLHAKTIP